MKSRRAHAGWLAMIMVALVIGTVQARDLQQVIAKGDLAKVKELVEADPQRLHREIEFHNYPLYVAIENMRLDIIRYLLEQGAKPNALDKRGENALFKLVQRDLGGGFPQVKTVFGLLVEHKVDATICSQNGKTALYNLAERLISGTALPNKLELMSMIIAQGAQPDKHKADIPILIAPFRNNHFVQAIGRMKDEKSKEAIRDGVISTTRHLLENGANPNITSDQNNTAMIVFIKMKPELLSDDNKVELVKMLIDYGANTRRKNKAGESPQRLVSRGTPLAEALKHKPQKKAR